MLQELATGSVEPGHIIKPIRQILKGRNVSFDSGMVQAIDMSRRLVYLCKDCILCHRQNKCTIKDFDLTIDDIQRDRKSALAYDYLILALGGVANFHDIEGAREYAFPISNLEAHYVAKSLSALLEGDPVEPFTYRELGSAISAGQYKGFVSLLGLFRLQGFAGWMAWKFTYLNHLISIRLSVRSLLEWLFDLTYDRDATRHKCS